MRMFVYQKYIKGLTQLGNIDAETLFLPLWLNWKTFVFGHKICAREAIIMYLTRFNNIFLRPGSKICVHNKLF